MGRLGYERYVSQGGDWGSVVSDVMARQVPAGLSADDQEVLWERPELFAAELRAAFRSLR
jgi:hypothetical protein